MFKISKTIILSVLLSLTACSSDNDKKSQELAEDEWPTYEEGIHFKKIDIQSEKLSSDVTIFFWYQCPHCNTIRKPLREWTQSNEDVSVKKIHSLISNNWVNDHMLYQALVYKGVFEKSFDILFDHIHSSKKDQSGKSIPEILRAGGIEISERDLVFTDQEKSKMVEEAKGIAKLEREIGAIGVPYIVVNGKYLVKNSGFNSYKDMFKFVNWALIQEDKRENGK